MSCDNCIGKEIGQHHCAAKNINWLISVIKEEEGKFYECCYQPLVNGDNHQTLEPNKIDFIYKTTEDWE